MALGALAAIVAASLGASKYNVVYFIADDLRPEFLAPYGQDFMLTPAVDMLAKTGLTFENAYCQQAVCGPSRASFMTGRRPARTRVFDNNADFRDTGIDGSGKLGKDWITCPEHFKQSGWTTLGGGKTFHPGHPPNFDEPTSWSQDLPYFPFSYFIQPNSSWSSGQPCPKNPYTNAGACASKIDTFCAVDEEDDHFYDFTLMKNTVAQLQYAAKHQPFFVQSGFARPHAPWRVPQKFWDKYNTSNVALPTHKYPPDGMPGIAWHQQGFYTEGGAVHCPNITAPIDDATMLGMRHAYQAAVSWMDEQIGSVLAELDSLGLTATTLVLLHGDHGWHLGEGNSWHKFTNFELGTRIPLVMRAPWMTNSVGKRSTMMVELVDVFPTVAALAGTPEPIDDLDGVSLAPVFEDPTLTTISTDKGTHDKTVAFSQFPHDTNFGCPWFVAATQSCSPSPPGQATPDNPTFMGFAARDKSWRFVVWLPFDTKSYSANWTATPIYELYDHSSGQMNDYNAFDGINVANEASNADTIKYYFNLTHYFFDVYAPPHSGPSGHNTSTCTSQGGIVKSGTTACCPGSCGTCGGKNCASLPGGNHNCCTKEIEGNGKSCSTSAPPCNY